MLRTASLLLAGALLALLTLGASAQAKPRDRDGDRLPDRWEQRHELSTKAKSASRDNDKDGLTNLGEFRSKTDPRDADSDGDGVEDGDEDRDRDDVDNAAEMDAGTHPAKRDSDDDGVDDGDEDSDEDGLDNAAESRSGNDPGDADSDDDGVEDGEENSGVVESFAGGVLTIRAADGSMVSGKVSDATEIGCEDDDETEDHEGRDGADHETSHEPDTAEDSAGACTQADLTPGRVVHEAELVGGTFAEIELVK